MLRRGKKDPTFSEQVDGQREAQTVVNELGDPDFGRMFTPVGFDKQVLDDEKILAFFDPGNANYRACLEPLGPFASRLLGTGNLTVDEVRLFCMDVEIAAEQCHSQAFTPLEHFLIDSVANHIKWRVTGAARLGFLLKTITENRKTLTLLNQQQKNKPWWRFW